MNEKKLSKYLYPKNTYLCWRLVVELNYVYSKTVWTSLIIKNEEYFIIEVCQMKKNMGLRFVHTTCVKLQLETILYNQIYI